jgi:hypothetical protein
MPYMYNLLAFRVTPKVFKPCSRVLHVMWGVRRVDYPRLHHDGHTHWRLLTHGLLCLDLIFIWHSFLGGWRPMWLGDIHNEAHTHVGWLLAWDDDLVRGGV